MRQKKSQNIFSPRSNKAILRYTSLIVLVHSRMTVMYTWNAVSLRLAGIEEGCSIDSSSKRYCPFYCALFL